MRVPYKFTYFVCDAPFRHQGAMPSLARALRDARRRARRIACIVFVSRFLVKEERPTIQAQWKVYPDGRVFKAVQWSGGWVLRLVKARALWTRITKAMGAK